MDTSLRFQYVWQFPPLKGGWDLDVLGIGCVMVWLYVTVCLVLMCCFVLVFGFVVGPSFGFPSLRLKTLMGISPLQVGWCLDVVVLGLCFAMVFMCVAVWLVVMCWFKGLGGLGVEPGIVLASLR